jgi:uncharacterized protein (UPF0332 family)
VTADDIVRLKVAKAREFLAAAEIMEQMRAFDAAVSLAVSAGINASDALILDFTGTIPSGQDHRGAIPLLKRAADRDTARQLEYLLNLKSKAQYAVQTCTEIEAAEVLKRARRLVDKSKGFEN